MFSSGESEINPYNLVLTRTNKIRTFIKMYSKAETRLSKSVGEDFFIG